MAQTSAACQKALDEGASMDEYKLPLGHQSQANPSPGARKFPEEEEKGQVREQPHDDTEYEAYFDERGRLQYCQIEKGSSDIQSEIPFDPYYYFRPIPQHTYPKTTPSILQSDTWSQEVDKHMECHQLPHEWPVEVRIMDMVISLKRSIRCDAYLACDDLNFAKEKVAAFRKEYARNHKTDEVPKTSTGNLKILHATDEATFSPAIDDYP